MDSNTLIKSDTPVWKKELQQVVTDPAELIHLLGLDPALQSTIEKAAEAFSLRVPRSFLSRMTKGDINDPLLRQVLPVSAEMAVNPGYSPDPLREQQVSQASGVIQKYHGRVLLIVNGYCAVNCRYCFRRHFPYQDNRLNRQQWRQVITDIAAEPTISEVIYSGGDPLAVSDNQLAWLTRSIAEIPHVKRLRIHTRLPVVIPSRIDPSGIAWLTDTRLETVMVLHINHANEINDELANAVTKLRQANVVLLNQTVLLKDINDNVDCLSALSETLFSVGIMPYYLHLLDKVEGAEHFDIGEDRAKAVYQQLLNQLPGYLVPKMVREVPHLGYKQPIV